MSTALIDSGNELRILSRSDPPPGIVDSRVRNACISTDNSIDQLADIFNGCESVVHLAAMNEVDCALDPIGATEVNVIGTQRALAAAIKSGVKQFTYVSTAHVYGAPLIGHITEETITAPVHPYSISHKAAEDYVLTAHHKGEISVRILRLSNSFGAPINPEVNRWTLVCNDLCRQAAENGRIVLKTSGTQSRDFITLGDVCRAVIFLQGKYAEGNDKVVLNLGGKNPRSIKAIAIDVIDIFKKYYGEDIILDAPQPVPTDTPADLVFDICRLESLGFVLEGAYREELGRLAAKCREWFGKEAREKS